MSIQHRAGSLALALSACTAAPPPATPSAPASDAHGVVSAALDAMGGEARLRAIHSVHYKTTGSWTVIEASPRPEPPWDVSYDRTEEWLDFEHGAWHKASEYLKLDDRGASWQPYTMIVNGDLSAVEVGGQRKPGGPVYVGDAAEQVLYQPFRLLLAAADARDLHGDGRDTLAGQPTDIVAFHHGRWPVRLWLDARTHRLAAAEIVHDLPDDFFWRVRGDVRDRLEPMQWRLDASGVWFAHQYNLIRNDVAYHAFVISELVTNDAPAERFAISDDLRAAYRDTARGPAAATAKGEQPLAELAPGVWLAATARANALVIQQPGGAVVIDAPLSEVYTARLLDQIAQRAGAPATSVVLSDHFMLTLAGVREVAARGVTIRALDANLGFVDSLLAAPHTLSPDPLARSGRRVHAEPIAARTVVGQGATRVELIPMRGTLGERVVLAWLPAARLLWVATALTLDDDGRASPSRLAELDAVIQRERLDVDRVIGSQLAATPWTRFHAATTAAR